MIGCLLHGLIPIGYLGIFVVVGNFWGHNAMAF